jgi:apolipoprotein N-acyltransferase
MALALSSAALLALAIPNEAFAFGCGPLGFLALVPLYAALLEAPSYGFSALVVGAFGALQHCFSSYWLWFFNDFRFWTLGSTTIAYGIAYSVLGLYLSLLVKKTGAARPLAFALAWTAFEYLKSSGFLGYPWGLLPYSLTNCLPFLQIADLTGVYGISFVLSLANASLAELLVSRPFPLLIRRSRMEARTAPWAIAPGAVYAYLGVALALTAGLAAYGLVRLSQPIPERGRIRALLVQQNVDPWDVGEERVLSENLRLARQALAGGAQGKPDIILFSETTLQRPYLDFPKYYAEEPKSDPLIPFIKETKSWLLTGTPIILDWDTMDGTNSAILIAPDGKQVASYAKVHPVPFAEAIPFWELPAFRRFIQKVVGLESGWVMGTEYKVFELPSGAGLLRFGAPICFEDAFSDVCRHFFDGGADILVNLTNDSWSKTRSAEIQHWAAARFRSIEFRRTMVRSTNGGLSCVIGPYGEVQDQLPLFEAASKIVAVPICRETSPTVYEALGDWFARAALLLSGLLALILMVRGLAGKPPFDPPLGGGLT